MILRSILIVVILSFWSCTKKEPITYEWKPLQVTATAYTSSKYQTQGDPYIGAFGDSLKTDVKSIAVSRDLYRLGLKNNTPVTIEGLEGIYLVKDRMHGRWKNKIDIYMGTDLQAAKNWGRKKVTIQYGFPIQKEP
jgi:3D (Asp-Asp-Asp) domain-containing protein